MSRRTSRRLRRFHRRPGRRPVRLAILAAAGSLAVLAAGPAVASAASAAASTAAQAGPLGDHPLPDAPTMLGVELSRLVRTVTATPSPSPSGLRAGVVLAEMAAESRPDDPEAWRLLLLTARLAEEREAVGRALEQLGRLAPEDDVVTLARLQMAMDERGRTVEERTAFLEFLVEAGRAGRLAPPVASRLAFELALLQQRLGDLDGFAEALLASLELDASHVAAARTALDFFAANVTDPVDEAELYLNLVLADPSDALILEGLGRLLLQEGAYEGAARIYGIAVDVLAGGSAVRQDVAEDLVADQALSLWGAGNLDGALRAIENRERYKQDLLELEREQRRRQEAREPGSTAGLPPVADRLLLEINLSSVRLAILEHEGPSVAFDTPAARSAARRMQLERERAEAEGGPGEFGDAPDLRRVPTPRAADTPYEALLGDLRAQLSDVYASAVASVDDRDVADLVRASMRLDYAWAAVLLLDQPEVARRMVQEAEALAPLGLSDVAAARFEGWIRLREGDAEGAIEALQPAVDEDPLARLGLALALEDAGQEARARVEFRGVAVAARGTITGVIAERRLARVYGETLRSSATAARLEGLVATVPATLDRLAWNRTGSLQLRVDFRERRLRPFEPVMVDVTLVNNGPVPLALDPRGPIVPTVLIVPQMMLAVGEASPPIVVVDVHRRLRLAPREQVTIPLDLRTTRVGNLLHQATEIGANLRLEAFVNHEVARFEQAPKPVFYPRALSGNDDSPYLRVEGVPMEQVLPDGSIRRSDEVDALIRSVEGVRTGGAVRLDTLGVVNRFALVPPAADATPLVTALRRDAGNAMANAFPQLDPVVQAWVVAVSPPGVSLPQYAEAVLASDDARLVAVWLVNMVGQVDDPVLVRALESDDERLRTVARAVDDRLRRADLGP